MLSPFLDSARSHFLLGEVSLACGQKKDADELYRRAAQADGSSDMVWAWASARKVDGYDSTQWQARLNAASLQAESNVQTNSSPGWWLYTEGVLQIALGETQKGDASLRRPNLLKSVITFTSRAERIITLLSWASSTSGVEGPFSKSKPSTARKSRSA